MELYRRIIKKTLREGSSPFTGDRSKLSWRREILSETDWANVSSGPTNSATDTFQYAYDPSITTSASGLGGVDAIPTNVDLGFGDFVVGPDYSQYSLAGYTGPLNNIQAYVKAVKEYEEASKEFEEKRDANFQAIKDTLRSFGTSFEELRSSKKWVKQLSDGTVVAIVPTGSNPGPMDWTNNVRVTKMKQSPNASGPMTINYNPPNEYYDWVVENSEIESEVYLEIGQPPEPPNMDNYGISRRNSFEDINPYLDASQEYAERVGADEFMNARVQDAPEQPSFFDYDPSKMGREYAKIANNTSMLPTFSGVPRYNPRFSAQLHRGFLFSDAIGSTLRYAFGLYDPKVPFKNSQSRELERSMLNTMSNAINSGTLSRDPGRPGFFKVGVSYDNRGTEEARDDWEGDGSLSNNRLTNMSAQGLLQTYSFKPTKKGIFVKDRFNLTGARTIGGAAVLSNTLNYYFGTKFSFEQDLVNKLIDMGDAQIRKRGGDPNNDATAGFDLEFIIPWERVPNNHPLRGNIKKSTTWDRIQKHR